MHNAPCPWHTDISCINPSDLTVLIPMMFRTFGPLLSRLVKPRPGLPAYQTPLPRATPVNFGSWGHPWGRRWGWVRMRHPLQLRLLRWPYVGEAQYPVVSPTFESSWFQADREAAQCCDHCGVLLVCCYFYSTAGLMPLTKLMTGKELSHWNFWLSRERISKSWVSTRNWSLPGWSWLKLASDVSTFWYFLMFWFWDGLPKLEAEPAEVESKIGGQRSTRAGVWMTSCWSPGVNSLSWSRTDEQIDHGSGKVWVWKTVGWYLC